MDAILGHNPPGKHYLCRQTRFSELPQRTPGLWADNKSHFLFSHPLVSDQVGGGWQEPWPGHQAPSCTSTQLWAGHSVPRGHSCCCSERRPTLQSVTTIFRSSRVALSCVFPSPPTSGKQGSISSYRTRHSP